MNAMAAIAPRTPIFANIIAPDMEACAAPARNRTALKSIHTTMEGGRRRLIQVFTVLTLHVVDAAFNARCQCRIVRLVK
jgi:hypothetical protein